MFRYSLHFEGTSSKDCFFLHHDVNWNWNWNVNVPSQNMTRVSLIRKIIEIMMRQQLQHSDISSFSCLLLFDGF